MKCCMCSEPIEKNNGIYAPKVKSYHWFCIDCYKKTKYYKEDTFDEYLKETNKKFEDKLDFNNLINFIRSNIGIPDSRFYIKKEQINKGNFSTKQYPKWAAKFIISDKELLLMFEKMKNYLNKQIKNIDSSNKVHYALAIVYNSYPKYLSYLEKQKDSIKKVKNVYEEITVDESNTSVCESVNYDDFLF